MNLLDMSFGDYILDMAETSRTAHCDIEDTALYTTHDFIEELLDDPIESQIHTTVPSSTVEESPTTIIEDVVPTVNEDFDVTQIHTTGPSSTVDSSPTTIIEDIVPTVNEDPDVTQIHTTGFSSIVDSSPMTIIEDIVPTVNEDPDVTQIHTMGPSSTVDPSPTTIIEDIVPIVNEDPDVTQTTLSPLLSPDVTFIMPVDDMPQTPGRKKVVKRVVKNVNIKDLPAKKRKRDNEDEDGYTGLRPRDVLRISRKGCGT